LAKANENDAREAAQLRVALATAEERVRLEAEKNKQSAKDIR
jgi:hypothetical protein